MDKQEALQWLVENIKEWPNLGGGYNFNSWYFVYGKDSRHVIYSLNGDCEVFGELYITEQEWLDAINGGSNE